MCHSCVDEVVNFSIAEGHLKTSSYRRPIGVAYFSAAPFQDWIYGNCENCQACIRTMQDLPLHTELFLPALIIQSSSNLH